MIIHCRFLNAGNNPSEVLQQIQAQFSPVGTLGCSYSFTMPSQLLMPVLLGFD